MVMQILIGWVLLVIAPKLAVLPVYRWLWHAMKASDELDRLDAIWLAERGASDGPPPLRFRASRHPRRGGPHGDRPRDLAPCAVARASRSRPGR